MHEGSRGGFVTRDTYFLGPITSRRVLARRTAEGPPSVVAWIGGASEMLYADFACEPRKRRSVR